MNVYIIYIYNSKIITTIYMFTFHLGVSAFVLCGEARLTPKDSRQLKWDLGLNKFVVSEI